MRLAGINRLYIGLESAYEETLEKMHKGYTVKDEYMQLEKLKPIMEEIAKERGVDLTDIFILYMDLQSEASVASNDKLKDSLKEIF